jgi:hypothetical protein
MKCLKDNTIKYIVEWQNHDKLTTPEQIHGIAGLIHIWALSKDETKANGQKKTKARLPVHAILP